jgi:hypothetical protein
MTWTSTNGSCMAGMLAHKITLPTVTLFQVRKPAIHYLHTETPTPFLPHNHGPKTVLLRPMHTPANKPEQ